MTTASVACEICGRASAEHVNSPCLRYSTNVGTVTDESPRCWRCRRKLAEHVSRPWSIVCERCHATNASAP